MQVSNLGRVRTTRGVVHKGCSRAGYQRVWCKRRSFSVHVLVAEAFLGPRPSPQHTVDHLDMDRSNNVTENLRWATPSEQVRSAYALNADRANGGEKMVIPVQGRPLRIDGDDDAPWTEFAGINAAARTLATSTGNVWSCLHGRRRHTKGYEFRFAARSLGGEGQEGRSREGGPVGDEEEQWCSVLGVWVSSLGRVQTKRGQIHHGRLHKYGTYATVYVGGNRRKHVHEVVALAFCGQRPSVDHTVDHVNNDPTDNRACNLRWATPSEQVRHSFSCNAHRQSHATKQSRPVRGRVGGRGDWCLFSSVNATIRKTGVSRTGVYRSLGRRRSLRDRDGDDGGASEGGVVGGTATVEWEFEYVPFKDLPGEVWRTCVVPL
jgi:hypothetical protein